MLTNLQLSVPNANLGKKTNVKTDANQSGEEYRNNQDITAPPDPIAPGTTSDVPIRGEKTNVLFHPTPSVSYEPMFEALEQRTNLLSAAIFIAIVVLGKMFGGALYGLIPLAMCISAAVFLWAKEVVRSGREKEWASERDRGKMVGCSPKICYTQANQNTGHSKSDTRICGVDEYLSGSHVGPHRPRLVRFSGRYARRYHAGFGPRSHRECPSSCN